MTPEHKKMLNSIRQGDTLLVSHGRGTIKAKVFQSAPFLVVEKVAKSGLKMQPNMISIFDVVEKIPDHNSERS